MNAASITALPPGSTTVRGACLQPMVFKTRKQRGYPGDIRITT